MALTEEQGGFDLKNGHYVAESMGTTWGSGTLRNALTEIERLRAVISDPVNSFGTPELIEWAEELQKIVADFPESERGGLPFVMRMGYHLEKFAKSWHCQTLQRQATQIEELEAELDEAQESLTEAYLLGSHKKAQEMTARIKELEKSCIYDPEQGKIFVPDGYPELEKLRARVSVLEDALVEERARRDHGMIRGSSCKFHDKCKQDRGNFCGFVGCPHKTDFLKFANQQLVAEGKIGNGDHIVGPCWQITEERKDAIDRGLRFLEWSFAATHNPASENNISILHNMLKEAE